jgi:glutathione S-transferase
MLTLYGHGNRTAANILKIRLALAEAGVEHDYKVIDLANGEQHKPEYLAINPHGKVPVLVDGSFALPESDAILWYVAEKFPNARLMPTDIQGRARVLQWCDFASTSLYTASYEIFLNTSYGEPANHSEFIAGRARTALDRSMTVLDGRLAGRQFVAVDALSIADFAIAAVVHMLKTREQVKLDERPNVLAHYERIAQRPCWQKATSETP